MKNTNNTSGWRRLAAAAGAIVIGAAGVIGISSAASAAPGPGQDGAPDEGSLTIHKYAGEPTGDANDGTSQSPDRPALAGVVFSIQEVTAIGGAALDLSTTAGWNAVAALGSTPPSPAEMTLGAPVNVTTGIDGATPTQTLDVGLYYVTETDAGPNDIAAPVQPFLVSIPQPQGDDGWLYDVHVYPKNLLEDSDAEKSVDDSGAITLGDAVSWTITTPAFSAHTAGAITDLTVTDDLVSQLNFVAGSVKASVVAGSTETAISAEDFASYFTVAYGPQAPGGVLTITANTAGLNYINSLPTSNKLAFTFDTTVVGAGEIVNTANVNFGGGTSGYATENVSTQWGVAQITKHDADDSAAALRGAEFSVYLAGANGERPAPGTEPVLTGLTTDTNGQVLINGLKAGQYWVEETAAPTGYVLPDDAWFGPLTVTSSDTAAAPATIAIGNTQQSVPSLPMTGANGQLMMTIGGIALVLIAGGGALAVRNRSKRAE